MKALFTALLLALCFGSLFLSSCTKQESVARPAAQPEVRYYQIADT